MLITISKLLSEPAVCIVIIRWIFNFATMLKFVLNKLSSAAELNQFGQIVLIVTKYYNYIYIVPVTSSSKQFWCRHRSFVVLSCLLPITVLNNTGIWGFFIFDMLRSFFLASSHKDAKLAGNLRAPTQQLQAHRYTYTATKSNYVLFFTWHFRLRQFKNQIKWESENIMRVVFLRENLLNKLHTHPLTNFSNCQLSQTQQISRQPVRCTSACSYVNIQAYK
jgi:hypothetical protein